MSISSIDLNLLATLDAVLVERNVARAAERLHVTPSAVSNALARLRHALGDPLVTRKGRGIVPTPRALELAPVLTRALGELAAAITPATFDQASCARTFTLAVADVGQIVWVPRLADAVGRELPRAQLRVVGIDALIALGDLASSEVDVHLGIAGRGPGFHAEPLAEIHNVLVARRGHPATARKLSRRALGELRHVRVDMVPAKRLPDPLAAAFARAGIPRQIAVTVPSFVAAAEVVAATDLVTMLPSTMLASHLAHGLRAVAAPLPPSAIAIAMSWHDRTHADPAARAFRAVVRAVVGAMPSGRAAR